MCPQQRNCRMEECGHYDKCFGVESGTREGQVILLEATVERAPQRLVVLSHGVKDESFPFWEVTSATLFYMMRKELHTGWWCEAEQQAWSSKSRGTIGGQKEICMPGPLRPQLVLSSHTGSCNSFSPLGRGVVLGHDCFCNPPPPPSLICVAAWG